MSTLVTFDRFYGDNAVLGMPLTSPDAGNPAFDPTGCILLATVKRLPSDTDAQALVQKISLIGGITPRQDGSNWFADLALVPADWANLTASVSYFVDVRAQNQSTGEVREISRAKVRSSYPITRTATLSIPTYTTTPAALFAALGNKVAFPATSGSPGTVGQWALSADYLAFVVATNTWRRAPLTDWDP